MDLQEYIAIDPNICHGKPCFKGTRIMVATILELLESGASYQDIRKGYPSLRPHHIRAALHFAHQAVDRGTYVAFDTHVHAVPR